MGQGPSPRGWSEEDRRGRDWKGEQGATACNGNAGVHLWQEIQSEAKCCDVLKSGSMATPQVDRNSGPLLSYPESKVSPGTTELEQGAPVAAACAPRQGTCELRRDSAREVPGMGAALDGPRPSVSTLIFLRLTPDSMCLSFPRLKIDPQSSFSEYEGQHRHHAGNSHHCRVQAGPGLTRPS